MSRAADGVWAGMGPRRGREGESEALCRSINTPVTLISNQPRTLKGRRECSGCFFTHVSPDVREGGGGGTGDGGVGKGQCYAQWHILMNRFVH